jgi:predicted Zn-dependent protease
MADLRDLEADLARALRRIESHTPYSDVLAERAWGESLRLDKQSMSLAPDSRMEGVAFRAWDGQAWVETATSGLTSRDLDRTVENLIGRLPAQVASKGPPGESPTGRASRSTPQVRPVADFGREAQIEWAKTCLGWATSVDGIENAFVRVAFHFNERLFLASSGALRHQVVVRSIASVAPLAIDSGRVEFDFLSEGHVGGAEILDAITEERVVATAREAKALLSAKAPPTGAMNVLLDPSTTGTFAHESFGHGTEADQLLRGRSYLKPLLGQALGPDCLTIVDSGDVPGGFGSIYFDDEGHDAARTVLVDHGKFVEVLMDRESAAELGRRPTGNTRRADFLSRPFVRMTNTFVEGGDRTQEELIQEARDGVLLQSCTSGIEDPLGGNMQIKVKKGRLIEHGRLSDIVSSMALSGKVLEVLRATRGVSRASDLAFSPGACGKGHTDMLPVATGGPYLLSHAVVGPA